MTWWILILMGFIQISVGCIMWGRAHVVEKQFERERTVCVDGNGMVISHSLGKYFFSRYVIVEKELI